MACGKCEGETIALGVAKALDEYVSRTNFTVPAKCYSSKKISPKPWAILYII